jgi:hypothetical protein
MLDNVSEILLSDGEKSNFSVFDLISFCER